MNNKWAIMRYSTVRPLEELPDTTFDELKEAIKKEEERREDIRHEHARELQKQIIELMRQIENEDFWIMYEGDRLNPHAIRVQ